MIGNSAIAVIMCLLFTYFPYQFALQGLELRAIGGVSTVEVWPAYFVVPFVFLILAGMFLADGVRARRGRIDPASDEDAAGLGVVPDVDVFDGPHPGARTGPSDRRDGE
jgi:TRAP-type C4-dicarboxylate transport system permease small subunit